MRRPDAVVRRGGVLIAAVLLAACSSRTGGSPSPRSAESPAPSSSIPVSVAPSADLGAIPDGTYRTASIDLAALKASVAAAGLPWAAVGADPGQTAVFAIRFASGRMDLFCSFDGSPQDLCDKGRYTFGGSDTIDYMPDATTVLPIRFSLAGTTLMLHWAPAPADPGTAHDKAVTVYFYNSAPFVLESTSAASSIPAPIADGTYATPTMTYDLVKAALVAHKISQDLIDHQMLEWTSDNPDGKQVLTIRLHAGTLTYLDRGGSIGWRGTFSFTGSKTMVADDGFGAITFGIRWDGPKLYLRIISDVNPNPGDLPAQAGGFEAAWFTVQP